MKINLRFLIGLRIKSRMVVITTDPYMDRNRDIIQIRPSLTTSKGGLKRLNIHCKQQGFNSEFGWSI
jgi:hypothetical protein